GQSDVIDKGGTLRLGSYPCVVQQDTELYRCYQQKQIAERHRHRYELNNAYRRDLVNAGLIVAGVSPDGQLVEAVEIGDHPFCIGVQFHPEFKSRPNRPHPLFSGFIRAAQCCRGEQCCT
ncbi:gamma-glutamyl-gamma-aminobutyrate hydrolase family protein, partial [Vibrio sp. FNV 38]|nr:gamma-glutamyl-gamma-aminobutyrate hydrolase family protein [Vibrio sp. FNV 38]